MEEIKVVNKDGKLFVHLSNMYKEPYWLNYMYGDKCIKNEDGSILIPCRNCSVSIVKPVIKQTHMGMIQTAEKYIENWVYFDVPEVSALVQEGDNLLDSWTLDKLKIELKEEIEQEPDES